MRDFTKNYARATEIVDRFYALTPEMQILIAQIRGNPWYKYKKAVKCIQKHLNNAGKEQFIIQKNIDFLLLHTDFNMWYLEFKEILNKCSVLTS